MKNKLLIFGGIFITLIILVIVSVVSYNSGYTKGYVEGYFTVGIGESCSKNTDCKIAVDYVVKSSCPFNSMCIENKCKVGCVSPYPTEEAAMKQTPQCNKNSDCNCSSFYEGNDVIRCSCVDSLCVAIVKE